jgi:hypothetical protein
MKTPPKITSILAMAVIGLAGMTMLSSAWGEAPDKRPAHTSWAKSDSLKGGAKYHGRKSGCRGRSLGRAGMYHKRGPHGSDHFAKKLSVMETEIGIRANQLDAWRDYTDALLAMKSPSPPERPAPSSEGTPQSDAESQPFARSESFAKRAIARGQSGEALVKAIETLRSTLTPEQLTKVEAIQAKLDSRPHHGHKPFCRHRGRGPHGGGHGAGPGHSPKPSDT